MGTRDQPAQLRYAGHMSCHVYNRCITLAPIPSLLFKSSSSMDVFLCSSVFVDCVLFFMCFFFKCDVACRLSLAVITIRTFHS